MKNAEATKEAHEAQFVCMEEVVETQLRLADDAQNWAKDLFEELTLKKGLSPEQAVNILKTSPFFSMDWVIH